ncbi:hypothetical protein [Cohaesibacter celericrescens]|uniref:hypothetical protein n=1 Tax=Cohaesibacter celericrescens TaxID=2067669 RepID=UPI0011AEF8C4|nr:hypothetical protein [Cohaesibacter celericrescens]
MAKWTVELVSKPLLGHNLGFACLYNGLAPYASFTGAADQIVGSSDTNDEPQQKGTTYRTAP